MGRGAGLGLGWMVIALVAGISTAALGGKRRAGRGNGVRVVRVTQEDAPETLNALGVPHEEQLAALLRRKQQRSNLCQKGRCVAFSPDAIKRFSGFPRGPFARVTGDLEKKVVFAVARGGGQWTIVVVTYETADQDRNTVAPPHSNRGGDRRNYRLPGKKKKHIRKGPLRGRRRSSDSYRGRDHRNDSHVQPQYQQSHYTQLF